MLDRLAVAVANVVIGPVFEESLASFKRAEQLSVEERRARTQGRLSPLLQHAAERVPFYIETYRQLGLAPGDLRTVDDLQRLPWVGKADHRRLGTTYFTAQNLPTARRVPERTSGSTGQPFEFFHDAAAAPVQIASHIFADTWFGLQPFDRSVRIRAPRPTKSLSDPFSWRHLRVTARTRLRDWYEAWTQLKLSAVEISQGTSSILCDRIDAFHPAYITGYTSAVAQLASVLLTSGRKLAHPVRGVITEAEPLTAEREQVIREFFGAPIGNRYGPREFGYYNAVSCPNDSQRLHINTEVTVWETVREDGMPARCGETGRVLLTDLHNYVMPFIRYDTGDLAVVGPEQCSCGRGFPVIAHLEGRSHECLRTVAGHLISPVALGQYLFVNRPYARVIYDFQLVQHDESRVTLRVVASDDFARIHGQIKDDLQKLLGREMNAVVERVTEIPSLPSGKRPVIIPRHQDLSGS